MNEIATNLYDPKDHPHENETTSNFDVVGDGCPQYY